MIFNLNLVVLATQRNDILKLPLDMYTFWILTFNKKSTTFFLTENYFFRGNHKPDIAYFIITIFFFPVVFLLIVSNILSIT